MSEKSSKKTQSLVFWTEMTKMMITEILALSEIELLSHRWWSHLTESGPLLDWGPAVCRKHICPECRWSFPVEQRRTASRKRNTVKEKAAQAQKSDETRFKTVQQIYVTKNPEDLPS